MSSTSEQIALLAVARAELVHLVVLERADELVREELGRDVDDARVGTLGVDAVGDGVHEVRLAEAGAAADEERVVAAPAAARRGDGRGVGELVRGAHDEVREGVLRVHPGRARAPCATWTARCWGAAGTSSCASRWAGAERRATEDARTPGFGRSGSIVHATCTDHPVSSRIDWVRVGTK